MRFDSRLWITAIVCSIFSFFGSETSIAQELNPFHSKAVEQQPSLGKSSKEKDIDPQATLKEQEAAFPVFEVLFTKDYIKKLTGKNPEFTIKKTKSDTAITWRLEFDLGDENPETYAFVDIIVAEGGTLLPEDEFLAARKKAKELFKGTEHNFEMFFPRVGARAQLGWAIGPGGVGLDFTVTTDDLSYDIQISTGNLLPEDSAYKGVDALAIVDQILKDYEATKAK